MACGQMAGGGCFCPRPYTHRSSAEDGGQTWRRERAADSLAANLYELVFTKGGLGFVLGNDGVLLRVRVGRFAQLLLGCLRGAWGLGLRTLRQRLTVSGPPPPPLQRINQA